MANNTPHRRNSVSGFLIVDARILTESFKEVYVVTAFSDRTIFIIINGEVLLKRARDTRTCLEWVRDMGYTYSQWEGAARGYILNGVIQFYTGRDYKSVDQILRDWINTLSIYHQERYGCLPSKIYNGVLKGEPGIMWPPIYRLNPRKYLH